MASEHTGGWRPIETAPNDDDTPFLVHYDNGDIEIEDDPLGTDWRPYDGVNENHWGCSKPTHWMPLPDPPAALALTAGETHD